MVTLLGVRVWSRRGLLQHGHSSPVVVSDFVQHSRHITFPHPNSTALSGNLIHMGHVMSLGVVGISRGCVGKKEGGAIEVSLEARSLGVLALGLPSLDVDLPPPVWRFLKCWQI